MRPRRSILLTTLAFPAASFALGLGDIHVGSALGQPLEAQIELIGTTAEEAATLTARILDDGEFRRHGLERPSFLSRSTLAVGKDEQGNPALIVHSIDGATEPVVTLLVGVHFHDGEIVREYTLLLDPADRARLPGQLVVGSMTPAVAADTSPPAPAPEAPITSPATTAPARARSASKGKPLRRGPAPGPLVYTVAVHDTLDRIARSAGASARPEVHRMAIAIYRANPEAFLGNLNLLRIGAILQVPSAAQLSAITAQDAEREYTAQMQSWRAGAHGIAPASAQTRPVASATVDPLTPGDGSYEAQVRALAEHVRSLQRSLNEVQQELKRPLATPAATNANTESREARIPKATLFAVLCGALALALGVWFYGRRRGSQKPPAQPHTAADSTGTIGERAKADAVTTSSQTVVSPSASRPEAGDKTGGAASPVSPSSVSGWFTKVSGNSVDNLATGGPAASQPAAKDPPDPTVKLPLPAAEDTVETEVLPAAVDTADDTGTFSFFNPQSLKDTTHLVMSSGLKEPGPLVERRKNPAEVLLRAIEREPHRSDLRLKLLELYYTGAAQNRRAFLEAAQQLAKNDGLVSPEDWSRIMDMGRALAPNDELFSVTAESKAVA